MKAISVEIRKETMDGGLKNSSRELESGGYICVSRKFLGTFHVFSHQQNEKQKLCYRWIIELLLAFACKFLQ